MSKLLLIGSGERRQLMMTDLLWPKIVTLDNSPTHKPDIVADLEKLPYEWAQDNEYDEIHAYEVLEHTGWQGDYKFFFEQWNEFHRILKKGGSFIATVPMWNTIWNRGDPGHKREINNGTLVFLSQKEYEKQVGVTPMADYRDIYHGDFVTEFMDQSGPLFRFKLRAL